jgi:hypothetical protein
VQKELYLSKGGTWYVHLYDRKANLRPEEAKRIVFFIITVVVIVIVGGCGGDVMALMLEVASIQTS